MGSWRLFKIYWGDGTNSVGVNGDNTHNVYDSKWDLYCQDWDPRFLAVFILIIWAIKIKIVQYMCLLVIKSGALITATFTVAQSFC